MAGGFNESHLNNYPFAHSMELPPRANTLTLPKNNDI